jgi:ribonuclease BN (tRNA processing enzyme)
MAHSFYPGIGLGTLLTRDDNARLKGANTSGFNSERQNMRRPEKTTSSHWVPFSKNATGITVSVTLALIILCSDAMPQSASTPPPPGGAQILLLGTHGGPPLSKQRSQPSTLLIVDGRLYLIDCGIGAMRQMVLAGVRSEDVGTIFITHHHLDHDLDLANIMADDFSSLNRTGATRTISIYGPPPTEELVEAGFKYISIPLTVQAAEGQMGDTKLVGPKGPKMNPFTALNIQHDGVVYQDEKVRVIAAENSHFAMMPAQFRTQMKSYSYRFETPHGVIVFTGDTGPSNAVTQLAKGADVLVSEGGLQNAALKMLQETAEKNHWPPERLKAMVDHGKEHLDVEEVGEIASKAQVKSVLLYHLGDAEDSAARMISGVKKNFSGPVFAGADFDRYCLGQARESTGSFTVGLCH